MGGAGDFVILASQGLIVVANSVESMAFFRLLILYLSASMYIGIEKYKRARSLENAAGVLYC